MQLSQGQPCTHRSNLARLHAATPSAARLGADARASVHVRFMSHVDRTCEPWDLCIFRLQWEPYSSTHFMLPRKYRVRQSRRRRHGVDRFACAAKLLDAVLSRAEDNRPRALPPALVECTIRIRHSNLYYAHSAHIFNHRKSGGRPA